MKNIGEKYDIVQGLVTDDELDEYRQCFFENGTEKQLEVLKWFHRQNVQKDHLVLYARDKKQGNIAAIYAYLPIFLKAGNSVVPALQSFDTLTAEKHRGQGLFVGLERRLAEIAKEKNNLVYGFANENSVSGFVKKLGFSYFGDVPFLLKPLNLFYFVKKILKVKSRLKDCTLRFPENEKYASGAIKPINHFGSDFDQLWQSLSHDITVAVNRNSEYMNWRYVEKPGANYARYGYYQNSILKGVVIFTLLNKHEGRIGYLMELLFAPGCENIGTELLQFANRIFKKSKADVVLAWCYPHSFNYICFKRSNYYNFPEKFRPQKLGVIVKELKNVTGVNVLEKENWYLSYSDSDTV